MPANSRPRLFSAGPIAAQISRLSYVGVIIRRFFGPLPSRPHWTDPIFYAAFPAAGYLALIVAGGAVLLEWDHAPTVLAIGALTLLFLGIRDAWDLALWLSTHADRQDH